MSAETAIRSIAKLYEIRDTVRRILGDDYQARMKEYGALIELAAKSQKMRPLEAAIALGKEVNPTAALYIMAAYVELVEPTVPA